VHVPVARLAMVATIAMENVVKDVPVNMLCQRQIHATVVQIVDQIAVAIAVQIVA